MNSLQSYRVAPSSSSSSSCTQAGVPSLPRPCGCGSPRWLVVGTLPGAEPRWARFWGGFDRVSWVSASGRCPQGWAGLPSAVPPSGGRSKGAGLQRGPRHPDPCRGLPAASPGGSGTPTPCPPYPAPLPLPGPLPVPGCPHPSSPRRCKPQHCPPLPALPHLL